ncbi:hypothetical protein WR25_16244 [Diploscapter pachys]|uniref:CX domain-containing protein n=1 Tax=Diploscapter pachys TaxID=2018661 RepID=A0A2A2KNV0_9BILA|nr:hypothetical protein WR25_16244 [Diploscapter pachys]
MRLIAVFLWLCLIQVALPKRGGSSGGRGSSSSRSSSSRGWGSSSSSRGSGSGGGFSFTKGGRSYQRQIPVTANRQYTSQVKNNVFSPNSKILTRTTTNTYIIKERSPYFSYGSHYYYWHTSSSHHYYHTSSGSQSMKTCRFVFDINSEERKKQQKAHDDAVKRKKELEAKEWKELMDGTYINKYKSNSNITDTKEYFAKAHENYQKFMKDQEERERQKNMPIPPAPAPLVNDEFTTYAKEDENFGQVQFENGTRVKEVSFQCRRDQACCGMECCDKKYETACDGDCSIDWGNVFYLILLIIVIVVGCYSCFARLVEEDREYSEFNSLHNFKTMRARKG